MFVQLRWARHSSNLDKCNYQRKHIKNKNVWAGFDNGSFSKEKLVKLQWVVVLTVDEINSGKGGCNAAYRIPKRRNECWMNEWRKFEQASTFSWVISLVFLPTAPRQAERVPGWGALKDIGLVFESASDTTSFRKRGPYHPPSLQSSKQMFEDTNTVKNMTHNLQLLPLPFRVWLF